MAEYNQQCICESLDRALKDARDYKRVRRIDTSSRLLFISDIHKGSRDCADDFRAAEQAYNAMLAYYYNMGHILVILGDAEELWENFPSKVLKKYPRSFELERKFFQENRYVRVWGNHDRVWSRRKKLQKHLFKVLGANSTDPDAPDGLEVPESFLFELDLGEGQKKEIFIVHGHQGSKDSDRYRLRSRLCVFIFCRPIQCLFGKSWNPKTPSSDSSLRKQNNISLYEWSRKQDNLILIAGHTHRPVFASESHLDKLEREKRELKKDGLLTQELNAEKEAEKEWVVTQELQMPDDLVTKAITKRCYFNTGCCCFIDGNTTAIEIFDGMIRLVHWPNRDSKPKPFILQEESLLDVLKV